MSDYSSQTVPQLKELLKAKGLATDGKKADLVQRLAEADQAAETKPSEQPVEPTTAELVPQDNDDNNNLTVVQPGETPKESAPAEEDAKPKVLTSEERKILAIELLTKKIKRAEKFGDDTSAETAKKDLARVEKFGVELGTALAREIGIVDKNFNHGLDDRRRRKSHHRGHGRRVFKSKHRK